ncbi:YLMG-like protein 2 CHLOROPLASTIC [Salix purpurea]|uniref:YLMG-like protein 2 CHLOROPLASTIC n=1 Tax=Salix purpurea TaxID=77065 RepID=A0A9Q0ZFF3_SALPP|nr:YLMG-like protein 2 CHLOROPLASTIC [Salix purpurea]
MMFECSTLCDPYLNIFRGIIPPLGGTLDLSPILAFLVLNTFTSTAAALPAELPENGAAPRSRSSPTMFTHLTTAKKKWMRRLHGNESKSSPWFNLGHSHDSLPGIYVCIFGSSEY